MELLTTESVSEGHPDKIADQVAQAICDFCLQKDANAHVACEVLIDSKSIFIGGEVQSGVFKLDKQFHKDIKAIVLTVIEKRIGFTPTTWELLKKLRTDKSKIEVCLHQQSEEIDSLVGDDKAGDNSTVFGFANSDPQYFPIFQSLANAILQKINQIRRQDQQKQQSAFNFAPDGKIQILFDNNAQRLQQIVLCQQFLERLTESKEMIAKKIQKEIIDPLLAEFKLQKNYRFILKDFKKGGPNADSGLTGRKLLIDNYGVFAKHGGGSFAGKDPTKTDLSLALFARFVAKHLVALNLAKEITVQVSSLIGEEKLVNITPLSSDKDVKMSLIQKVIERFFTWKVGRIVNELNLKHTEFLPFATYGYFGRKHPQASWEKLTYHQTIKTWLAKTSNRS